MRGAYDASGRSPQTRREGRDAGRRQDTEIDDVRASARCAGAQGAGEHLSGEARVASYEELASERQGGGESEAKGIFWQEAFVGDPAHPVGAERCGSFLQSASSTKPG